MIRTYTVTAVVFLVLFYSIASAALTPVARPNVVPYQRISPNSPINFGVVAFSKNGIDRVDFNISGQGFTGGTKTSTAMSFNPQSMTYEYWVPIAADEFASNGPITVTSVAVGKDGGIRESSTILFAAPSAVQVQSWVDPIGGSDTSGEVGNRLRPYSTIGQAITATQNANNGSADGVVINLLPGTYASGMVASPVTTTERLVVRAASGVAADEVVLTKGGTAIRPSLLLLQGITLQNTTNGPVADRVNTDLWIDGCRLIGKGRHLQNSSPVPANSALQYYLTNSSNYNSDYGMYSGVLARNISFSTIGNDAFANTQMVINARVDDLDPGATEWHADGYQSWGEGPNNRIIYGYYGTNFHYQGLFLRATLSPGQDNAFINIFMEMMDPGRDGGAGVVLSSGSIYGEWDHLLVWNCSFPHIGFSIYPDDSGYGFTNSSFIGNFFYEFKDSTAGFVDPSYAAPGNAGNNDFLHNHYVRSYTDVTNCAGNPQPVGCPHYHSTSPDSSALPTQTVGGVGSESADFIIRDLGSQRNGQPYNPLLVERFEQVVPVDAVGAVRKHMSDVGAISKRATRFFRNVRLHTEIE